MESVRHSSLRRKRQANNDFSRMFHATRTFILHRVLERYNRLDNSPHISSSYSFESSSDSDPQSITTHLSYEFDSFLDLENPFVTPATLDRKEDISSSTTITHETLKLNHKKTKVAQFISYDTFQLDDFDLSDDEFSPLDLKFDDPRKEQAYIQTSSFSSRDIETITFLQILADPFMVYSYMRLWGIRIKEKLTELFRKGDESLLVHAMTVLTMSSSIVTIISFASQMLCLMASSLSIFFCFYLRLQLRYRRDKKGLLIDIFHSDHFRTYHDLLHS
jgi:hypothetical protein